METVSKTVPASSGSSRMNRARLEDFLEQIPVATCLVDLKGNYLFRSEKWREFEALILPEGPRDDHFGLIAARRDWVRAHGRARAGETVTRAEDTVRTLDGKTLYFAWIIKPWYEDGALGGVSVALTKTSDQVEARMAAERQTELFNAVLENVEDGIVACNQHGDLTLFNRQTRIMHGIDAVSIPVEECGDFYSLYEADGVTPLGPDRIPLYRALNGEVVSDQTMVIAPEGLPRREIVAQATQLRDSSGAVIGAVASMSDVTEARMAMRKLRESKSDALHRAFHDALTGLANRARYMDRFGNGATTEASQPVAAIFVDLDRFKRINDTLGHPVGDRILARAATILSDCTADGAFLARLGGDEFVCILDVASEEEAMAAARCIHERLSEPLSIDGHMISSGASVGVALSPGHGKVVMDLVRRADIAMYRAKADAHLGPVLFEPVFELQAMLRAELEKELLQSIEKDELRLLFQPIICSRTGDTLGAEALVRWDHPRLGLIGPDRFIPVAEDCGFISELGSWVLDRVMDLFADRDEDFVSVNLSPLQFQDPELVDRILAGLARSRLSPERLELEVTESILISDARGAARTIEALRRNGVRIALDDFGTGYSSLRYIQQIPFNKVKIDRSFTEHIASDASSLAVVRCVVGLAGALGMTVTAEGVETQQQEDILREIGCHSLQGYRYSEPVPLDALIPAYTELRHMPE